MKGQLILAANSIGSDADIPARTLEMLRVGDLLVFEEDRPARKLLKAAGVHRDYLRHNEHNQQYVISEISAALQAGKTVVYTSDQGCAGVADPGRELIKLARELGASIRIIPGPSSITAAISACHFDCSSFDFVGLLPRDEKERLKKINQIKTRPLSQIIIDAPYRLLSLLKSCDAVFGASRQTLLALDITGEDESYLSGSFSELISQVEKLDKKLNFVLIIAASS